MATSQLTGVNYEVDGKLVTFFDAKGMVFGKNSWAVNALGDMMVEVDPDSIMDRVRSCIDNDVEAGNGDKIAQLQLAPRQAVVFYLEGMLNRDHLKKAVEGPNFIDIPDVDVGGRSLTVRIQGEPEHEVATADAEGNILE